MYDTLREVELEDIAFVIDPQPDHRAPQFVEGGFSYVGIGDIDANGNIHHEQCRKVSEFAVIKQEEAFHIDFEDIAFGKVGTIGKVVYLKEPNRYAVSATLVIIKPKKDIDRHFLFHLLQSLQAIENISFCQTGTTRATLGIQLIRSFKFLVPPIKEQRHIADILDIIDTQIQHTEQLIAKLKLQKTGLLQNLLTCGLDGHGQLRDPISHPEQFKVSVLGRIPKEWKVSTFEDLAYVIDPQPDHRAPAEVPGGEPYVGVGDFRADGSIDFDDCRKVSPVAVKKQQVRFSIEVGDIIFGKIGTIGLPQLLPSGITYALSANVVLIKPKGFPSYVLWLLRSPFVEQQIQIQIHSTSQPAFGIQRIRAMRVPIPSKSEQVRIAKILDDFDANIRAEASLLSKLQLYKKGLMQDLLTGRVRTNVEERTLSRKSLLCKETKG